MGELAERDGQISERDAALTARDTELARHLAELNRKQLKIDQLTHEMAILKRWQFAKRSEQVDAVQYSLLAPANSVCQPARRSSASSLAIARSLTARMTEEQPQFADGPTHPIPFVYAYDAELAFDGGGGLPCNSHRGSAGR